MDHTVLRPHMAPNKGKLWEVHLGLGLSPYSAHSSIQLLSAPRVSSVVVPLLSFLPLPQLANSRSLIPELLDPFLWQQLQQPSHPGPLPTHQQHWNVRLRTDFFSANFGK